MNKPFLIAGIVIVVLVGGGLVFRFSGQSPASSGPAPYRSTLPVPEERQAAPPPVLGNTSPPPPTPVVIPSPTPSPTPVPTPTPAPTPAPAPAPAPAPTPPPAPAAVPATISASIADFAFSPNQLTVKAGTKVMWTNSDAATHTVTSDDGVFESGSLSSGKTFSFTFSAPGSFSYHCGPHPSMRATVTVTQ